jgi:hypothetical protein
VSKISKNAEASQTEEAAKVQLQQKPETRQEEPRADAEGQRQSVVVNFDHLLFTFNSPVPESLVHVNYYLTKLLGNFLS